MVLLSLINSVICIAAARTQGRPRDSQELGEAHQL